MSRVLLEKTFHFIQKLFTSFLCIELYNLIQYYVNKWCKNVRRKKFICMKLKGECFGKNLINELLKEIFPNQVWGSWGKNSRKILNLVCFACITGFALYVKEMKNRNSTLVVDILEESMKPKLRPSNKEKLWP